MPQGVADESLQQARLALDRGEYGRCLRLLEPIAAAHPIRSALGGRVRLLMATALIGQGESSRAAACCRGLEACADPELRRQARDLQLILEAPQLRRPESWSLTLPPLGGVESLQGRLPTGAARGVTPPRPPTPPPVGPTRSPLGFAVVALLLLVLLTGLLGGCLRVDTEVRFTGPGRLQLRQTLESDTGQLLPWQRRFAEELRGPALTIEQGQGRQILRSGPVPAAEAARLLRRSVAVAAGLNGLELPPPLLELQERNWLLGVRQRFRLELDLRQVRPLPGLSFSVSLAPVAVREVRLATPLRPQRQGDGVAWPLASGALNRLELQGWRWSRLGLGTLAILLLLLLTLTLQRLRRQVGYGWPELPAPGKGSPE